MSNIIAVQDLPTQGWDVESIEPMSEESGRESLGLSYTIGLTPKVGYELVVVNASEQTRTSILYELASQFVDETAKPENVTEFSYFQVGDTPIRLRIENIDLDSTTALFCTSRVEGVDVTQIKQIFIPDANNLLPGEEGYDESFVQVVS